MLLDIRFPANKTELNKSTTQVLDITTSGNSLDDSRDDCREV